MKKVLLFFLCGILHAVFVAMAMNGDSLTTQLIGNVGSGALFGAFLTKAIWY